ncbi:DUF5996 family protein [Noviherbaspirillum sp.]|uniref:DUF5996 family protein n=1 Tax=Noviherbaspirillum sp. TaxID=1926288 RepID=UPI002B466BF6|nr:DUF5996 family protein [Noviherbaspirillum sp.]HJV80167.1 DUF5996 family protein [Noviherbaspirillum sp.]HJW56709.1 DUF5996 family protein [Burkholderiaceae bacterium]
MAFSMPPVHTPGAQSWPDLPFDAWRDTLATLHMWTQIVGKIRLVQTPFLNHSWHVTLYVTARGLTTSPIPYGTRIFEIDFDFIDHRLRIRTSDALTRDFALRPCSVADFYRELFRCLAEVGLDIKIHAIPNEVLDAIPFEQNYLDASYDPEYTNRFWRILTQVDRVFKQFRTGFIGKCSPVHFFWGSFDLALTRFSGRTAPPHPGGVPNCPDWVIQEAYSHELSSCGFWPGSDAMPAPVFYAYAYPEPAGFKTVQIRPDTASYDTTLGEFILPYAELRQSHAPDAVLLEFLQSAYEAAANLGQWDRASVERSAYRK